MADRHDGAEIAASRRDPDRFEVIFDRHYDAVVRFAAGRVGRVHAHDVAAEVFVRAFDRRHLFREDRASALPWLFGIATNVLRERHRKETRGAFALRRMAGEGSLEETFDVEAAARIDAAASRPVLAWGLERLSDDEYQVLMLAALGDLTYEAMAADLGIPIGTVRSRLHRARRRMRDVLDAGATGPPPAEGMAP